jgi:SHS2 domain-containing protein
MTAAFEQAATALMSIILDLTTVEALEQREIQLTAADADHLLVKWLTELLYLYDGRQFAAKRCVIKQLTPTTLIAVVAGEQVSLAKHRTSLDVKAVTYHQLSVTENENGARVRVFLDI